MLNSALKIISVFEMMKKKIKKRASTRYDVKKEKNDGENDVSDLGNLQCFACL